MKPPAGLRIELGERRGDHVETRVSYCPCGGSCHESPSPCSFGCLIHHPLSGQAPLTGPERERVKRLARTHLRCRYADCDTSWLAQLVLRLASPSPEDERSEQGASDG